MAKVFPSEPADSLYRFAGPVAVGEAVVWLAKLPRVAEGAGARILLLHGNPANLDDWRPVAYHLRAAHEVFAADLPGFGRSDRTRRSSGETPLDASAHTMVALADALGWTEPFVVVGHSHGGAVAQAMATNYPERIAGIVLIASMGAPTHASYRLLEIRAVAGVLAGIAALVRRKWCTSLVRALVAFGTRRIYSPAVPTPEDIESRYLDFLRRPDILLAMADAARGAPSRQLHASAARMRAHVLILHGEDDVLVPLAHMKTMAEALRPTSVVSFDTIPNAGHMIHITHASDLAERIIAWAEQLPTDRWRGPVPSHGSSTGSG